MSLCLFFSRPAASSLSYVFLPIVPSLKGFVQPFGFLGFGVSGTTISAASYHILFSASRIFGAEMLAIDRRLSNIAWNFLGLRWQKVLNSLSVIPRSLRQLSIIFGKSSSAISFRSFDISLPDLPIFLRCLAVVSSPLATLLTISSQASLLYLAR